MSAGLKSLLLDTSALIALADPAQPQHETAQRYLREALRAKVTLYLSVVCAAEFQQRQAVTDLPLRNFIVLPFNIDHAMVAGELMRHARPAPEPEARAAVRDDMKLIAQAVVESIGHMLTEGESALTRHVALLGEAGRCRIDCIRLDEGYDGAWFSGGQKSLPLPDTGA